MEPFLIEVGDEGVEAFLLLQDVLADRLCRLILQGEMHALLSFVLLRMSWLDAFDLDAQAEPPDGQFREVEETVGPAKGTPLSDQMAAGSPSSANRRPNAVKAVSCLVDSNAS